MGSTKHLYDQIAQATNRLAQLKARELLAAQREAARQRETARRNEALRKNQLGALVFAADCEDLPDGEIIAALLNYRAGHPDAEGRAKACIAGDSHLAGIAAGCVPRSH